MPYQSGQKISALAIYLAIFVSGNPVCAIIVGLTAYGEAGQGKAKVPQEHMGSIDTQEMVEEILEGGRNAFEMRRLKYGF